LLLPRGRSALNSLSEVPFRVEKPQARADYLFHRIHNGRQNLVWHDFVRMLSQASFQAISPRNAKFRIDVYDVDSRRDCLAQVFIIGSRTTVEGQKA
jgi:hypothetical protein